MNLKNRRKININYININNHNLPNPFNNNESYDTYAILKAITSYLPKNTISMSPEDKKGVEEYPFNDQVKALIEEFKTD